MHLLPHPGQIFTNYNELAKFLGEPIVTGNSRIAQFKKWRRFFDWDKHGHQLLIKLKADDEEYLRFGSGGKWKSYVDPQILALLSEAMRGYGVNHYSNLFRELILFNHDAFAAVGLCNENYRKLRKGELDLEKEHQLEFIDRSYAHLYAILHRALDRLHQRRIIYKTKTYVAHGPEKPFIVTAEQTVRIELLKERLLRKFGINKECNVFRSSKRSEFYLALQELVMEDEKLRLRKVYPVIQIAFREEAQRSMEQLAAQMREVEQNFEQTNKQSQQLMLKLFPDPPLNQIVNLVIPAIRKDRNFATPEESPNASRPP